MIRIPGFESKYQPGHMVLWARPEDTTDSAVILVTGVRFYTKGFPTYYGMGPNGEIVKGIQEAEIIGYAEDIVPRAAPQEELPLSTSRLLEMD